MFVVKVDKQLSEFYAEARAGRTRTIIDLDRQLPSQVGTLYMFSILVLLVALIFCFKFCRNRKSNFLDQLLVFFLCPLNAQIESYIKLMFDKMGAIPVIFCFFSHLNIKQQHLSRNSCESEIVFSVMICVFVLFFL
jgi:hypothetical protein